MQTVESGSHDPLIEILARLERRLDRLESRLEPVFAVVDNANAGIAAFTDTVDEKLAAISRFDERLEKAAELVELLTEPETLEKLHTAVRQFEEMPKLVATTGDVVDEWMKEAAADGVNVGELAESLNHFTIVVLRLLTNERFRCMLERSILTVESFVPLEALADGAKATLNGDPKPVGLFGAMGAMRDPDIQLAVGFALETGKIVGKAIRRAVEENKA